LNYQGIKKLENLDGLKNLKRLSIVYTDIKKLENLEKLSNLKSIMINPESSKIPKIPNSISKSCFEFLKQKNVLIDDLYTIDEFITKKNIKVE
jgi:hypothetical protein